MLHPRLCLLITIIAALTFSRLFPHPPNFSIVTAMALFSGAYFVRRDMALLVTGTAMLLSDFILGFHALMWVVYLSLGLTVFIGAGLQRYRQSALPVVGAALGSALLFFFLTNTAHWAMFNDYPHTFEGLITCYVMAIPFFQNALLGDLLFTVLLFDGMTLLERKRVGFVQSPAW